MEEDIKILDEVVGRSKELREKDFGMLIGTKQMHSIENLIKGYRELEKDLHEMTILNNHKKEIWGHKNCLNEYIPKSKIKEKIEELKETADEDNQDDYIKIQVLKELAEAFEKHIPNIE